MGNRSAKTNLSTVNKTQSETKQSTEVKKIQAHKRTICTQVWIQGSDSINEYCKIKDVCFYDFMNGLNNNYGSSELWKLEDDERIRKLTLWGGRVYNCGEDELSELVQQHAETLETFFYFPDDTKGGVMLRPCYNNNDRAGTYEFPALTHIGMKWTSFDNYANPSMWYIAPSLRTFTLMLWMEDDVTPSLRTYNVQTLRLGISPSLRTELDKMHSCYPLLEEVRITIGNKVHTSKESSNSELEKTRQILVSRITPPMHVSEKVLAYLRSKDGLGSMMDFELLEVFLSFIHQPDWIWINTEEGRKYMEMTISSHHSRESELEEI